MSSGLITRQPVEPEKLARARQFRHAITHEEAILWERLRANRFRGLHFRRQQVLFGFIVDFFCNQLNLAVEVDGGVHESQNEADAARDQVLTGHGLRVLRVSNHEVCSDMDSVLEKLAAFDRTVGVPEGMTDRQEGR